MTKFYLVKHKSERAKEMKRKRRYAYILLDTAFENAKRSPDEGHKNLELFEAIVTTGECNLSKSAFVGALDYLEKNGDILILHKGHKDQNSVLNLRNKRTNEKSINGTVVKCLSRDIYDFLSEEEILRDDERYEEI